MARDLLAGEQNLPAWTKSDRILAHCRLRSIFMLGKICMEQIMPLLFVELKLARPSERLQVVRLGDFVEPEIYRSPKPEMSSGDNTASLV